MRIDFVIAWCLTFLCIISAAVAADARQVFETVAPSTVLIEDVDSFGSGIFLNDKGLILTNYHVVAANIELKVRARVRFGNRMALTELDGAKVIKVHKAYDLALVEVKAPPNGAFVPARFLPQTPPMSTGIKCYAIGNPGGPNGKALELSITEGLVSAAFRKIDNLEYTQISAQINPGNSGGPVCDKEGRVLGITTWKMTDTEGIGFAIPTQRINMADFVDLKAKAPDLILLKKATEAADSLFKLSLLADGQDRNDLLLASAEAYHVCMVAAPANVTPYYELGIIYRKLQNFDLAKKYIAGALRLEPANPRCLQLLGTLEMDPDPSSAKSLAISIEIWFRGIGTSGDNEGRSFCAVAMAKALFNQQKWAAAAYMLSWADSMLAGQSQDPGKEGREMEWQKVQLLPDQIAAIRQKKAGFSRAEFDVLAAGKPLASILPAIKPASNPSGGPATAVKVPDVTETQMAKIAQDAREKFTGSQIAVPPEGLEFPLPDVADRAVLAYAGWQVVISFPELMKLGVFNLATGQMEGFIDCSEHKPMLAAGGQVLAVYSPSSKLLEVYDLATRQRIASRKVGLPAVSFLGMGILNPSRIFVLSTEGVDESRPNHLVPSFITIPELWPVDLVETRGNNNPLTVLPSKPGDDYLEGGMDEKGGIAAVGSRQGYYSGQAAIYYLQSDNSVSSTSVSDVMGMSGVTKDGRIVVARRGLFDSVALNNPYYETFKGGNPYCMTPTAGYPACVALINAPKFVGIRVIATPYMTTITTLPITAQKLGEYTHGDLKDQTETMLASAYCDRIAYVLPMAKKIVLFPLGIKGGAPGSAFAELGKHFERKLSVPAGATVAIQSGPPGLKYNPATTTLVWEVPRDTKPEQIIQVIILVTGTDSKQSYMVEKIPVQ